MHRCKCSLKLPCPADAWEVEGWKGKYVSQNGGSRFHVTVGASDQRSRGSISLQLHPTTYYRCAMWSGVPTVLSCTSSGAMFQQGTHDEES